jgi:sugar (pentulose or hexulose) kinase
VKKLFVAGGLTKSRVYCQIMADSANVPVFRHRNAEATMIGCLISACVSRGEYPDYEAAFKETVTGPSEEFPPDGENKRIYAKNRLSGGLCTPH